MSAVSDVALALFTAIVAARFWAGVRVTIVSSRSSISVGAGMKTTAMTEVIHMPIAAMVLANRNLSVTTKLASGTNNL
ncbi:hypothetical protein [Chamaesiphon sp.]|uniref:hypothetical protein n=1 Tax=Chamaesiphon sp. TaxID=2814140 RepID=UPI003593451F